MAENRYGIIQKILKALGLSEDAIQEVLAKISELLSGKSEQGGGMSRPPSRKSCPTIVLRDCERGLGAGTGRFCAAFTDRGARPQAADTD